jgi:hypothetical protein
MWRARRHIHICSSDVQTRTAETARQAPEQQQGYPPSDRDELGPFPAQWGLSKAVQPDRLQLSAGMFSKWLVPRNGTS